jgi:hypothetical protein
LVRPRHWKVYQALDPKAARQSTLDRRFDEGGAKESERDGVNRFSSGEPERLRRNLTRRHRAGRHVSNHDRRREIIQGKGDRPCAMRPMRTEARAVLTDAVRDAYHWLDELTTSPNQTIESLAAREDKTERWIRRTAGG